MTTAYWAQWSHSELMSMQGVELDEQYDEDIDYDVEEKIQEEHCCGNCMDCLGMSWRDFF